MGFGSYPVVCGSGYAVLLGGVQLLSYTILENEGYEDWLEQRRKYVTATELSKLIRSPGFADDLRAFKLGIANPPDLRHVPAVQHGVDREPDIAAWVQEQFPTLIPNRSLCIAEGEQIAATPDAISTEDSMVGEFKTVRADVLTEHMLHDSWPTPTYFDQVQVQLAVTGYDKCVFAWEPYSVAESGQLVALEDHRDYKIIEADPERQRELIRCARVFLGLEEPTVPDEVHMLVAEWRDIAKFEREEVAPRMARKREIQDALKEIAGKRGKSFDLGDVRVTVSKAAVSHSLDSKRLKADHPALAAEYVKKTQGAQRVTMKEI